MSLVVDSSIAVAWIYDDERTKLIENVLDLVVEQGAWVPTIWRLEVANALQQGILRRRIDRLFRNRALARLANLRFNVDAETSALAWGDSLTLADRFRLTLYDACYLELAQRRGLPLASLDHPLRGAAQDLGLDVLGA